MKKIVTFNRKGFLTELNNLKINTVAKLKAKLKSTLKNEVQENLHAALPNVDGETVAAWKKFKNEITIYTASVNPVNKNDLPQEVYEAVMQGVIARDDSIKSKIELGSIDGETIKRVGRWFSSFANNDEVIVSANGENYTITMFMNASAQIAFADKNCTLSGWNVGTSAKKAINSFIKDLQSYVEDYRINIWRELLKDAAGALLDEFIDELGELHDGVAKDLFEKLKNYIELESESSDVVGGTIDKFFELIPATKNLIYNIEKNYKTFIEKLNALVNYSQTTPDDADDILTAKQYNAFVSACEDLEIYNVVNYLAQKYLSYEYSDVTSGEINESHASINCTDDADQLTASGSSVTINAHNGDDSIRTESNSMIFGEGGDDTIDARGYRNNISGGEGDDDIRNEGDASSITGDEGDDGISNYGDDSTVEGGEGDDIILVAASDNSISGGNGNDEIAVYGECNIINGGSGDDKIYLVGDIENCIVEYSPTDGNDTIYGYDENTQINIAGDYVTSTSERDVIISVGDSSITLVDASGKKIQINNTTAVIGNPYTDQLTPYKLPALGKKALKFHSVQYGTNGDDQAWGYFSAYNVTSNIIINMLAGNDTIYNNGNYVMVNGGDGNDLIHNSGDSVTINGDNGDDYFYNNEGDSVTINGGNGNDSIHSSGDSVKIAGGDGDDSISAVVKEVWNSQIHAYETITGNFVSVDGGDGNDSISNCYSETKYGSKDYGGDNFIAHGNAGDDCIQNMGNASSLFGDEGNDFIVNGGSSVLIDGGDDDDIIYNYSKSNNVSINGGDGDDRISNDGDSVSIDGGDILR